MTATATPTKSRINFRWRVVDIIVAAVLAVAVGLVFFAWNQLWEPVSTPLDVLTPGLGALTYGFWLIGGVLGAFVIRKPGAAVFVEVVAAVVSMALGAKWGMTTVESGIVQGLAVELLLLVFLYSNWRLYVAILAGAAAGVAMAANDLLISYPAYSIQFKVIYAICAIISGAVIAGLGSWAIVKGLAKTGVLNRFASGRTA